MSKSRKNKNTRVILLPENYIRKRSRKLPVYKCLINSEWNKSGRANITVARRHANGNVSFCWYMVDKCCLGLKNTSFSYNVSQQEFDDYVAECNESFTVTEVSYNLVHNIIFTAIEYAGEYGFKPHKNFISITKYFLEEDNDDIPFIDIHCGGTKNRPLYFNNGDETPAQVEKIVQQLEKTAGEGNFEVGTIMEMSEIRSIAEAKTKGKEEKEFCDAYRKKAMRMSMKTLEKNTISILGKYLKDKHEKTDKDSEISRKAEVLAEVWREKSGILDRDMLNKYLNIMNDDFNSVSTIKTGSMPNSLFPTFTNGGENLEFDFIHVFMLIHIQGRNAENAEKQLGRFVRKYGDCEASIYLKCLFNDIFNVNTYPDLERQFPRYKDYFLLKLMQLEKQLESANSDGTREQLMNLVEGKTITKFELMQFIMSYMIHIFGYSNIKTEHLIEKVNALVIFLENYYMNYSDFTTRVLLTVTKVRLRDITIFKFITGKYPLPPEKAGEMENMENMENVENMENME